MSFAFILMVLVIAAIGMLVLFKKQTPTGNEDGGLSSSFSGKKGKGKSASPPSPGSKIAGISKKIDEVRKQKSQAKALAFSLHQIDGQPADFFGRKGQFGTLINQCKEGQNLLGLFGPRGIGKTATATKLIEALTPVYPEAQIYFDFDTVHNPDEAVAVAMAHVLNSMSPSTKTPGTLGELTLHYRKALQGKRILLLLDNVKKREDAVPFLPPAKSAALLLTSEKKLAVEGVFWEELEPLPEEDLKALLEHWASRVGFWSIEIIRYTASNAQATVLCGRILKEFTSFDPETFATKLRDIFKELLKNIPDRNQVGRESVYTLAFLALPDPLKNLLAKLLQFPGGFFAEAEEFICEDTENIKLEMLIRLGFVECNEMSFRFRVPPTLAHWLKQHIKGINLGQFEMRRATYYMTRLQMLNELIKTQRDQALIFFDMDWKNFQAGQSWAQANCLKDNEIAKICLGYAEMSYSLLQFRRLAGRRSAWLEGGLLAAKTLQDDTGELNCLVYLSQEYNALKEWSKAIDGFEKALPLAQKLSLSKIQLEVLHGLGIAYLGQESWNKALDRFQAEALEAEKTRQNTIHLRASEEIARTFLLAKDPGQALNWLEKALENARLLKDAGAESRILALTGKAQLETGNAEDAINTLQAAIKNNSQTKDTGTLASLHHHLGEAFMVLEEPAKAAASFRQASQKHRNSGDALGQAKASGQQGICLLLAGDKDQGLKVSNTARSIFRKLRATGEELEVLQKITQIFIAGKSWEDLTTTCQAMRQLAKKEGKTVFEGRALHGLAQASEALGKPPEALSYYQEAYKLLNSSAPGEAKKLQAKIKQLETSTDHI